MQLTNKKHIKRLCCKKNRKKKVITTFTGHRTWKELLHPRVLALREELKNDVTASHTSPFLPLMQTWTYQTCERLPDGPPHVKIYSCLCRLTWFQNFQTKFGVKFCSQIMGQNLEVCKILWLNFFKKIFVNLFDLFCVI